MEATLRNLCSYSYMLRTLWSILISHYSRDTNIFAVLVVQSQVNPEVESLRKRFLRFLTSSLSIPRSATFQSLSYPELEGAQSLLKGFAKTKRCPRDQSEPFSTNCPFHQAMNSATCSTCPKVRAMINKKTSFF